ncbi:myosin light chain 1 [Culex quinquefasciatus]|uniref:Myosin light chain alkali n=2 Tax=Culex pipiens complex TaxID=518105 RepID=B0X1Z6_CULQU|nr:myosin light chain alkali isoform X2 [Culex quinquefasciatus]XP_039445455.1 myosin light chain alkali isoform X2 [Culex pipiens pallens]EDS38926.1 myosin light chain 1 [Culex quinquefasciatus]|eukprot:XP_001863668.1 myosin light chain 1 [Culex quinquefasciatus]
MADLKDVEVEKAKFVFSVYDWDGSGSMDAMDIGPALRALNLNPTLELIGKMGGTKKRGEKKVKLDEFLPIYAQVKKEKDMGCYEDFLECLKLYDKEENGTMLLAELEHSLLALGEKLDRDELDDVFKDCMDPEDDDGNIPYAPFLQRLCDHKP